MNFNSQESRNLILAIALSAIVLIGWNYFFAPKAPLRAPGNAPVATQTTLPGNAAAPGAGPAPSVGLAPAAPAAATPATTRADALAESPRVAIDTVALGGSINLNGGILDDLVLKAYRETIDPKSPMITLFNPIAGPSAYWAETGFVTDARGVKTPNRSTRWTANLDTLKVNQPVTLTWDNGEGLKFTRELAVDDRYMFTVTDSVENMGSQPVSLRPYGLILRRGKPQVAGYAVLHEGYVGVIGDSSVQEVTYNSIEKETNRVKTLEGVGGWLGFTDKYWASAIIPDPNASVDARFVATGTPPNEDFQSDLVETPDNVAPGASATAVMHIFAGAKEVSAIDGYQKSLGIKKFDLMIDWGWFYFITKPLFSVIDAIYHLVGNFGVAILIVTVLVRGVLFPLANASYRSMAKMKMLQPQIAALKDTYPDDKQKQQQAQMELFRKEGVNPVAGCVPMVFQIPVFFALYKVIFITIEMRHAPFFGWIRDLSAPDPTNIFTLFGLIPWDPTQLPMIGHFLALGIWPIIMGISMFFQMKMNPEPADPVQKQMFAFMPLIFTFMLGTFPAGLVIYWTWSNTLTILQQSLIMKRAGVKIELFDNLKRMLRRAPA
jgi:YidC/Oxa1 family membrane protein insertase